MKHSLAIAGLLCLTASASGQTLQESIDKHDEAVSEARAKVAAKYRELIQEATEKTDFERLGKLRYWSQRFESEGVLWLPPKQAEMTQLYRDYGKSLKTAGDALRGAYTAEIKRLNAAEEFSEADALTAELEALRLPAKTSSLQLFRSKSHLFHFGLKIQGEPVKDVGIRMNATFEIVPGLIESNLTSIRSVNWPDAYIDHVAFRVRLSPVQDNDRWRRHATWVVTPGLADAKNGISFRSVTHPDRYIRVRANGEAWLDVKENSPAFRNQATFIERRPLFKIW